MPIDIEDVVKKGYERTVARNGLIFVGIFYLISLLDGLFSPASTRPPLPPGQMGDPAMEPIPTGGMQPYAPSLGLSPVVAGILSLVLGIISLVVTIAAIRTFVSGETEQIPDEYVTHNLGWAVLNLVIGGIVFGIVLAIGFALLFVPGVFLLVSLFFWAVYVVVEDQSFVEGFQNSWRLTRGHRLRLFALGLVTVAIAVLVGIGFGAPGLFLPDLLGFLIAQLGSAFLGVFYIATIARTYNQLVDTGSESL